MSGTPQQLLTIYVPLMLFFIIYYSETDVDYEHGHEPGDALSPPVFSALLEHRLNHDHPMQENVIVYVRLFIRSISNR